MNTLAKGKSGWATEVGWVGDGGCYRTAVNRGGGVVLRGWIRSLACHYGSRALPLANPICYRLIGQITYYYRRFISHISPRLRPLVTSQLITGRCTPCPYPGVLIASTCVVCLLGGGKGKKYNGGGVMRGEVKISCYITFLFSKFRSFVRSLVRHDRQCEIDINVMKFISRISIESLFNYFEETASSRRSG